MKSLLTRNNWSATFALAGAATMLLAGCGAPGGGNGTGKVAAAADAPTGEGKITGKVEVVAFKGGFGIDFYQQAASDFNKANPGANVSVSGNPRVWDELRPRLASGDAPDLMFPGWGFDHWKYAQDGGLMVLDKALDSPAVGSSGTWRSTFEPSILKLCQLDGKTYILPYYFNVWGWWYDPAVFASHGWAPPTTFSQLMAMAPKIKAAGLSPLTYQGKYPYYMFEGMVLPWVQDIGGIQAVNDMQDLKPGAWKSPALLKAITMIDQLNKAGFFEPGAVGLSHTESQSDFVNGKVAMIPCGTWLDSEMKNSFKPGQKIAFMPVPFADGGTGDPTRTEIDIEPWMVPAQAKNPNGAIAFYKYMTSLPVAQKFVQQKGSLMAIVGSDNVTLPGSLVGAAKAFHGAKTTFSYEARYWYPDLEDKMENSLTGVLNGTLTPAQFCDACEKEAQAERDNKSVTKHTVQ